MSRAIEELQEDIINDYNELEDELCLDDKLIKDVIKRYSELRIKWEKYRAFAKAAEDEFEYELEEARENATKRLRNNQSMDMTYTEAHNYALSDPTYLALRKELNTMKVVIELTRGALNTLDDMKWHLKAYTDLIVRGAEETIL